MHLAEPADSGNRVSVAPLGSGPAGEFSGVIRACRIDMSWCLLEIDKIACRRVYRSTLGRRKGWPEAPAFQQIEEARWPKQSVITKSAMASRGAAGHSRRANPATRAAHAARTCRRC